VCVCVCTIHGFVDYRVKFINQSRTNVGCTKSEFQAGSAGHFYAIGTIRTSRRFDDLLRGFYITNVARLQHLYFLDGIAERTVSLRLHLRNTRNSFRSRAILDEKLAINCVKVRPTAKRYFCITSRIFARMSKYRVRSN